MKAYVSISCQLSWFSVGTGPYGAGGGASFDEEQPDRHEAAIRNAMPFKAVEIRMTTLFELPGVEAEEVFLLLF